MKFLRSVGCLLAAVLFGTPFCVSAVPFTFITFVPGSGPLNSPAGLGVDPNHNTYVADAGSSVIRLVSPTGAVSVFAGIPGQLGNTDGAAASATFEHPAGIAVYQTGSAVTVYVSDSEAHVIRKIDSSQNVTTFAGSAGQSGSADGAGTSARFNAPAGLACDTSGNLYVADQGNQTIRKIAPDGTVSTIAGLALSAGSTDGTGSAARFNSPAAVAVDGIGCVYVADLGNHTVRKLCPSTNGYVVLTLAGQAGASGTVDGSGSGARFAGPNGIAVDPRGALYVADGSGDTIRGVTAGGTVSTVAGVAGVSATRDGTGTDASYGAQFTSLAGLALSPDGDLYVTDANTVRLATNGQNEANYVNLALPFIGEHTVNVLGPNWLELKRIVTEDQNAATTDTWSDFIDSNGNLTLQPGQFTVRSNGTTIGVASVNFRRHPLYGKGIGTRDLRVESCIFLQLSSPLYDATATPPHLVLTVSSTRFPETYTTDGGDDLRYSPVIHVNEEGYLPNEAKIAVVGYYIGNVQGSETELPLPANTSAGSTRFELLDSNGNPVTSGSFVLTDPAAPNQKETGWDTAYSPPPYQKTYVADFSSVTQPGEYRLHVPALGVSLPFRIDDGIAMKFLRALAYGLYQQRCGYELKLPYTSYQHGACHLGAAQIPNDTSDFADAWDMMRSEGGNSALTGTTSLWYPYTNTETSIPDVSGGHHDAGDYNKYTVDSAFLISNLMFAVDYLPGGSSNNLGIPESGDSAGVPDLLKEAKWEADYLMKLQDAGGGTPNGGTEAMVPGGFYTVVYAKYKTEKYNPLTVDPSYTDPDHNNQPYEQFVWPVSTSATADAVAALAQCASSPTFRKYYASDATKYLTAATNGWKFLLQQFRLRGFGNTYQQIHFYGASFNDADDIAWAACELFLATGDASYKPYFQWWTNQSTRQGFDPTDRMDTYQNTWDPMFEGYGNIVRSVVFAATVPHVRILADGTTYFDPTTLDSAFVTACQNRITQPPADSPDYGTALTWRQETVYGASMPDGAKHYGGAVGYFHALMDASTIAMMQTLSPNPQDVEAMIANLNYEAGTNPSNVAYITGTGWRRQREYVSQLYRYTNNTLPPTGLGIVQMERDFSGTDLLPYSQLVGLTYPAYGMWSGSDYQLYNQSYPMYDRWTDIWNTSAEGVTYRWSAEMMTLCALVNRTNAYTHPWQFNTATISSDADSSDGQIHAIVGQPVHCSIGSPSTPIDATWRIVWQSDGSEPAFGATYTYVPTSAGTHWVQFEALNPEGQRMTYRKVVATTDSGSPGPATPTVQSFTIASSTSTTVTYQLTFSESVTGVDSSDFTVTPGGGATTSGLTVSGSGASYTIVVTYSGTSGTIDLALNSSGTGIVDGSGNALASGASAPRFTIGSQVAAAPTFSPGSGTYASAQSVTISTTTSGATIYYTTDGSTPTTASSAYSGPVTVNATTTLKAIATAPGYSTSSIASATYTISTGSTVTITMSPSGDQSLSVNQSLTYSTTCTDTSGQMDCVAFFWQDPYGHQSWDGSTGTPTGLTFSGPTSQWSNPETNASWSVGVTPTINGTFYVKWGVHQASGSWTYGTTYALVVNGPTITMTPAGDQTLAVNQAITYSTNCTDPSGQMDCVAFFWQDPYGHQSWDGSTGTPTGLTFSGPTSQWSNPETSASLSVGVTPTINGTFYVKWGIHQANGSWTYGTTYALVVNGPTITMSPAGDQTLAVNQSITYSTNCTDPSGQMDCVAFFWQDPYGHQSWDGSTGTPTGLTFSGPTSQWSNPETSASWSVGVTPTASGTYYVKWGIHEANGSWVYGTTYQLVVP